MIAINNERHETTWQSTFVAMLPEIEQGPARLIATGRPELALAVTPKEVPYADVAGAPVNVMVWFAFSTLMVTDAVAVL